MPHGISRAGPEIHRDPAPAFAGRERQDALDVDRVGAALQAVEQDHARALRRTAKMVQNEVVAVLRLQDFPLERDPPAASREASPHGLGVGSRDPPGRRKPRSALGRGQT